MECAEFRPRYADLISGKLPEADAQPLKAHRQGCVDCQTWAREEQALGDLLRTRLPCYSAPASLVREIRIARRGTRVWWPQATAAAFATALVMVLLFLPLLPRRSNHEGFQSVLPALIDEHIRTILW